MSNIVQFPQREREYSTSEIEELRQSVDELTEELNRLNSELEEPPKKEKGRWLWFALGALLGLTW